MATTYSNEVAVGTYNRIRLKCDYSGTSATISIQFRRTSSWTGTWYDNAATLTFNGQTKSASYSYTGTVGTSWVTLVSNISGYTISSSGGTYSWTFNNTSGGVLGCSGDITISSQATAPYGGEITSVVPGTDSFTMTGGVASMGTGGTSTTVELVVLNAPYTQAGIPQRYESFHTLTDTKTITNLSPAANGGITITPNKLFYIGIYAHNGVLDYRFDGGSAVTLAEAPTLTVASAAGNSAVINYSASADGGEYDKVIEYSLDGGTTWQTGTTISGGSAASGTFTISGLTPGVANSVQTRVTTDAGSTIGTTLSISPIPVCTLYGSVGGQTKKIKKLYCSVGGQAKRVKKLYASVGGVTKLVFEG